MHWARVKRTGEPGPVESYRGGDCTEADCNQPHYSNRLCELHYKRQTYADPDYPRRKLEWDRRWAAKNRQEKNARYRAKYANDADERERRKAASKMRQALRRGAGNDPRPRIILLAEVMGQYGWTCQLCGLSIDPNATDLRLTVTIDHIVPVSRGGAHVLDNIQPAHLACNASKGDRLIPRPYDPRLFLALMGV